MMMNLHSPKDEHCGFATDDMTDAALKSLLIDTMKERESLHYVIGWLRQSYCSPGPADIERVVAIKKLQEYNSEVV